MVRAGRPGSLGRKKAEEPVTAARRRRSRQFRVVPAGSASATVTHGFQSSQQDFSFGPCTLTASKTHMRKSADAEKLADELHMPSLPEMMFGENVLRVQHGSGFGIEVSATEALRCVNNYQGMLKVACAEEWQEAERWWLHCHPCSLKDSDLEDHSWRPAPANNS